jgi:hypothetical protein
MKTAQKIAMAFIIGGALAVVGQLLATLLVAIFGAEFALLGPLTLVCIGIFGGVLYLLGLYPKLEKWGEFGAFLPFSGFCVAIANMTEHVKSESGSASAGAAAGAKLMLYVGGFGILICVIIALLAVLIDGSGILA